jgi:peptidoglycan-N-acetylglucosamine deacetylase
VALFKVPSAFPFLFRKLCWKIRTTENVIYLTFDDGPEPAVTPFVLDLLSRYNAKATFFCIGKNAKANKTLFDNIVERGHAVGNHTFSHIKGWTTDSKTYLKDVEACDEVFSSTLFRPPYGKITATQYRKLVRRYSVVLWDVITHDYKKDLNREEALRKTIEAIRPGSVVVFHDSLKAKDNLEYLLPKVMEHFASRNFTFRELTPETCERAQA